MLPDRVKDPLGRVGMDVVSVGDRPAKQRLSVSFASPFTLHTCGYVPRYCHTDDSWLFIKVGPYARGA